MKSRSSKNLLQVIIAAAIIFLCLYFGQSTANLDAAADDLYQFSIMNPDIEPYEVWAGRQELLTQKILKLSELQKPQTQHAVCLKAFWKTENSLLRPPQKVGVLAAPPAPIKTWVRFSNADILGLDILPSLPNFQSMSIKVMTDKGSQDFVMTTLPRYFVRDADDLLKFFESSISGGLQKIFYFSQNIENYKLFSQAQKPAQPWLTSSYYSGLPSRLGVQFMRFRATPCEINSQTLNSIIKPGRCFRFFIQPNLDPAKNALENPTQEWNDQASPWVPVAHIEFLENQNLTPAQPDPFCDNLDFNPWQTDSELRPEGQINRVRKVLFEKLNSRKHQDSGTAAKEPRGW